MSAKRRANFAPNQNCANSRKQEKTNERWHSWLQWRKVSRGANGSRLNGSGTIGDDRGNFSIYFPIREGKAIPAPRCPRGYILSAEYAALVFFARGPYG